ncbi:MAG: hypothetical protein U1D55_10950 [Phycisphaerae bacterium]
MFFGTPGQAGTRGHAEVTLNAPILDGDFDLRIYVSHCRSLDEFKKDLTLSNPRWVSLGGIVVRN